MHKTNVPYKAALGYAVVAIVLLMAITLVYRNTKSILAINQASQEYIKKRNASDSTMASLLKEEQINLRQLSDAMEGKTGKSYLKEKVTSLNTGKDSIVVHPKALQTHEAKSTTVEVVKTRKGFFRRLADAFKKERSETLSIKKDSNRAIIDSVTTPVNVAENVADILQNIEQKEKSASLGHDKAITREMEELQMVNAQLALRSAKELNKVHQRERNSMQQAINKAMEARQHLLWQIVLLAIIAILATIILLWYIWRDTKKERLYRESLEEANEEIQRIMQQRERLLLTITHDIKAPAASISGFIDLMKEYIDDPRGINCLHNIKNSADHLSRLVASLLDYHQLENGLMKAQPITFSPHQLVTESTEGMRWLAEKKGLKISCNVSTPKESMLFCADAFRIRQILDNLISNAIKYTENGSIYIQASISKVTTEPNDAKEKAYQLTFSVRDTGKGMTEEETHKVFQAFTRLKSAQGIEGTGLGLSITHELVVLLHGKINLSSVVGKGSTFTVTIPMTLADNSKNDAEKNESSQKSFTNHKILVLDDDTLQLQLLQEMLHRLIDNSWTIIACNHVTEALTALHQEHPAIMMMDIEMPEMNGTELIKHINHSQMMVIAMTAHDTSIKEQLLKAGFDECLFKPFSMKKLGEILGVNPADIIEKKPQEPIKEHTSSRFDSLLAFAEDDEDGAKEILRTVQKELEEHLKTCQDALAMETLPNEKISKAAHKLLPIATMIQMKSIEIIKNLSPEQISNFQAEEVRRHLDSVCKDLQDTLMEMREILIS